jgi:antitoxin (DNA-binding transcriptional repressor) of toxin-antitoxin stability system
MATTIKATDLSRNLSDVLSRVHCRGETFLIERNGEPVATLEPIGSAAGGSWRELASRLERLSAHDATFADDLEQIQQDQSKVDLPQWPLS